MKRTILGLAGSLLLLAACTGTQPASITVAGPKAHEGMNVCVADQQHCARTDAHLVAQPSLSGLSTGSYQTWVCPGEAAKGCATGPLLAVDSGQADPLVLKVDTHYDGVLYVWD